MNYAPLQWRDLRREYLIAIHGRPEREVKRRTEQNGDTFRVVKRDGKHLPFACNYNPRRVNVEVKSGFVVRAWYG